MNSLRGRGDHLWEAVTGLQRCLYPRKVRAGRLQHTSGSGSKEHRASSGFGSVSATPGPAPPAAPPPAAPPSAGPWLGAPRPPVGTAPSSDTSRSDASSESLQRWPRQTQEKFRVGRRRHPAGPRAPWKLEGSWTRPGNRRAVTCCWRCWHGGPTCAEVGARRSGCPGQAQIPSGFIFWPVSGGLKKPGYLGKGMSDTASQRCLNLQSVWGP